MAIPRSVRVIDKFPYPNAKYNLGTKIHEIIEFTRELHDHFSTSGTLFTLVNEIRTRLHTAGDYQVLVAELRTKAFEMITLTTELRARLHTAGDYQVLLSAIRALLITDGDIQARLQDLEDKAYNQILTDPGWQEDAVNTQFECANQIDAVIDGVYTAAAVAATTTYAPTTPAWDTGVGETRKVTLSTTGVANNITATIGAIDVVTPPRPPSGQCPIGVVNVPASFTGGTTQIVAGGVTFTDGFPRRLDVHTPIATADVAVIAAPASAAGVAAAPAAIAGAALTTTSADKVESLPDRG